MLRVCNQGPERTGMELEQTLDYAEVKSWGRTSHDRTESVCGVFKKVVLWEEKAACSTNLIDS